MSNRFDNTFVEEHPYEQKFTRTLAAFLVLFFLPLYANASPDTTVITLDEVLLACDIDKSEFDLIEVQYTESNIRSGQSSFAYVLRNEEPQQGTNRAAFVLVYDKEGCPITTSSMSSSARGSNLFRLENAGVAIAGYYYYDVEYDYTLGLNFYSPYQVDVKWTTLVSGADITPTRITATYTSAGDGYSSIDRSNYLGVKTHVVARSVSNPTKAQRYSRTLRPSYVMRFDAPPLSYSGDLWGSELEVSATVGGKTYSAAVNVDPGWAGLSASSNP